MNILINNFFEYLRTRDLKILIENMEIEDDENITVIIINILSWLKLERKRTLWKEQGKKIKHKPMKMNVDFPWCRDLEKIIVNENMFNKYFQIKDGGLVYSDDLSEEEKEYGRILAHEKYNPTMVVD